MSPALAQDPVVTRTGIHKILGPLSVRSIAQAIDPLCRDFTDTQIVVIFPTVATAEGLAGSVVVTITRIRRQRTRWLLRPPV